MQNGGVAILTTLMVSSVGIPYWHLETQQPYSSLILQSLAGANVRKRFLDIESVKDRRVRAHLHTSQGPC
jgi:hypothetical protein